MEEPKTVVPITARKRNPCRYAWTKARRGDVFTKAKPQKHNSSKAWC
jgi:ribosomal protein L24E